MDNLRVSLVQAHLVWENTTENLTQLYGQIKNIDSTDVIILPEMFATGFTMDAKNNATTVDGEPVKWMQKVAQEKNACVTGSLIIEENGAFYNRLFWVQPDLKAITYNKRHLFTLAGEEKVYAPGEERQCIEYKGWRIMPQVCYDLRFPAWCRNNINYDLLFFVANWPERRSYHWQQLLIARAIENQAYVVGVNRVGPDGNNVNHSGNSAAIDALGQCIYEAEPNAASIKTVILKKAHLQEVRSKFSFLADQDSFTINK